MLLDCVINAIKCLVISHLTLCALNALSNLFLMKKIKLNFDGCDLKIEKVRLTYSS
jgi:hypothetical protein